MKKTTCSRIIFLLLMLALFGCTGLSQEERTAKSPEPTLQPAEVAKPQPPDPDESDMIRLRAKEELLGKWKRQAQGDDTIEFFEDGTVNFYSAVEKVAYPGSYLILDKDRIEITMAKGGTLTWGYAVAKGELTLTAPTGVGMKYKRFRGGPKSAGN